MLNFIKSYIPCFLKKPIIKILDDINPILRINKYGYPSNISMQVTSVCKDKIDSFILPDVTPNIFANEITYCADGMISHTSTDWLNDEKFKKAYMKSEKLGAFTMKSGYTFKVMWRSHVLCWAASRAVDLEGDFVECGVYLGGQSRTVMEYIDFEKLQKKFYLLDTYTGTPEESLSEEEKAIHLGSNNKGENAFSGDFYKNTCENFKEYPNALLIQGIIPETLSQVTSNKIAYLHMDLNCAKPEIEAAEYFWDKMVSGAALILDDYGWVRAYVQRNAWNDFAKRKGVKILSLPTCQGLIIKP